MKKFNLSRSFFWTTRILEGKKNKRISLFYFTESFFNIAYFAWSIQTINPLVYKKKTKS